MLESLARDVRASTKATPLSFIVACSVLFLAASSAHALIEEGLSVGIRDFAVLPDSTGTSLPARAHVMTADPLGRLFVNDQRGPLHMISPDGSTVTNYLDLSTYPGIDVVLDYGEQGFNGFAFHPDFATPSTSGFGKFYTIHSESDTAPAPTYPFFSNTGTGSDNTHDTVLFEWTVPDPTAATYAAGGGGAPRQVLRLEQPHQWHNSGLIAFNTSVDPNHSDYGNLYIALGDGGSGLDPWEIAEDPASPYGKILRIDPLDPNGAGGGDYSIVSDNIFASDGDPNTLAEVYAYGFRNPQRIGWDDVTGDMYLADIGQ